VYTRCPSCQSVYQLAADDLAEAAGVVRCGNCGKTFNSLGQLFSDHPQAGQQPREGKGTPPLLEKRAMVQPDLPGFTLENEFERQAGPSLSLPPLHDRRAGKQNRLWMPASLVMAALLIVQLGWQWTTPDSALNRLTQAAVPGMSGAEAAETIQIVSRDMHRHPTLDDAVIISATLRNPSTRSLEWPMLEVRLYDPSQQVLGARRLDPQEYLDNPRDLERGMSPNLMVPVILEFVVGTTDPSGFDFRFF
jgi:predicted Zn finger-like uncharacterized protein